MITVATINDYEVIGCGQRKQEDFQSLGYFLAMMANATYREVLVHPHAGLQRTILLQMQG